jgi:hypothetical protein
VRGLVESICKNCERLKLWGVVGQEPTYLVALTAFGTTLAMNFLQRGNFTGDKRKTKATGKEQRTEAKAPRAKSREQKILPEARSPRPEANS